MSHNTPICYLGSLLRQIMLSLCLTLALPTWAADYAGTGTGTTIPDLGSMSYTFNVTGQTAPITLIKLAVQLSHTWFGDLVLELKSPGNVVTTTLLSAQRPQVSGVGDQDLNGVYTFVDPSSAGAVNIWTLTSGKAFNYLIPPSNEYMTMSDGL
jgi:hypothetical protein